MEYHLSKRIPVEEGYDLVVAGGGPAGCAAAICASRLGAKVLLVEATGCLGGMGTSGLVTAFDPMANGEMMVVGGFMREVVEAMYERGFLPSYVTPEFWRRLYHRWTPFNAEGLKLLLDELAAEAGVEVRFFTKAVEADVDSETRRVNGVVLHNVDGFTLVRAQTYIDATGDAILSELCGADYLEAGRDTEHIMPPTLCALVGGVAWDRIELDAITPKGQQAAIEQAVDAGFFSQPDRHVPGMFRSGETVGFMNAGHVFHMNAVKNKSLSQGMMQGRRLAWEYLRFYQQHMDGFQHAEMVTTGALMGVRESRRVVGEYQLSFADYLARRRFPDQIAIFAKAVDIHVYDCTEEQYRRYYEEFHDSGRLAPGEWFGIPYRILVPKGWQNLWVAGRCASSDIQVHGSIRVQPAAAMMGQAAGTAAVQAMNFGETACSLDTDRLVDSLRQQGAVLPETP